MCRATPGLSGIHDRFVKHSFRAENPNVLCESLSTGRSLLKWLERWRGNRTFSGTMPLRFAALLNARQLAFAWVA
jgi:hypothetical protein